MLANEKNNISQSYCLNNMMAVNKNRISKCVELLDLKICSACVLSLSTRPECLHQKNAFLIIFQIIYLFYF